MKLAFVYQTLLYIENPCPKLQTDIIMKDFELVTLTAFVTVFSRTSLVQARNGMRESIFPIQFWNIPESLKTGAQNKYSRG